MAECERRLLTGWGRTAPTAADVHRPTAAEDLAELVRGAPDRGTIARGLGRSYGDAAQVAGGVVLDLTGLDRILAFDVTAGRVRAQAGLSLDRLVRMVLPFGWFVPVTPGTRFVTLGGSLAADIHGKNHHVDGSFAKHVPRFRLVDGRGDLHEVSPDSEPDVFWGTAGGMGLTGLITDLEIQLRPVSTSRMLVDTERAKDLDELLALLEGDDDRRPYSVAWLDAATRGRGMGRGVLTRARHATIGDLEHRQAAQPLRYDPAVRATAPDLFPNWTLNRASVLAFNELWYRKAPRRRYGELQDLTSFFHPLDGVGAWNRIYGPRGFLQYQFVVPPDRSDVLREAVGQISSSSLASFLAVLKRFGPENPGPLSFPREGWTLALDFPNAPGLHELLTTLDRLVVNAGGRVYLAKDARLPTHLLPAMYPRLEEFRAVREKLDPDRRFVSDLARRLDL